MTRVCIMAQHRTRAAASSLRYWSTKHQRRGRMGRFVAASVAPEGPAHIAGVLQALPLLTGSEMELARGAVKVKVVGARALGMGHTVRSHPV